MHTTTTSIRVRYGETDQMGIVYHGNYPSYCEVARIEFFRQIGLPYKELEAKGIIMPVTELDLKFHKPAYYDDILNIRTTLREIPSGARIFFDYEIYRENGELLTTASTTLAFVDNETRRPLRCPEMLLKYLRELESK